MELNNVQKLDQKWFARLVKDVTEFQHLVPSLRDRPRQAIHGHTSKQNK